MSEPATAANAPTLVREPEELEAMLRSLTDEPRIALDVEGDGLYRYRARLCIVQIAGRDRIWIVDALAAWDAARFRSLLGSEGPAKVLHDAAFDARLLRECGAELGNVVDTAVAARFLGERNTGLASLLSARCDTTLDKGLQKADWGRRPLDARAIDYLAEDVRHLFVLADSLWADVARLGIEAEVEVETAYMLERARFDADPGPQWLRVKGVRELGPEGQGVVRALVELRDRLARARDVPPFKVFGDSLILTLAARRWDGPQQLAALRDVRALGRDVSATDLLDAIREGEQRCPSPAELALPAAPSREQRALIRAREKALSTWRRDQAQKREVDPQVVLPGHCLNDLAARGAHSVAELHAIAGIGSGRVVRDGEALLSALLAAEASASATPSVP